MSEILELKNEIKNINKKLDIIINILEKNTQSCNKMSSHIDFVENVYDTIKSPLGYICNKINYFSSSNTNYTLENIEDIEEEL